MELSRPKPGRILPRLMYGTLDPECPSLAGAITEAASPSTYHIIGSLVDRDRMQDAYRAYAYFRWVDDWLDQTRRDRHDRLTFVKRQQALIDRAYTGAHPHDLTTEEQMVVDLIRTDDEPNSGLRLYIQNMMAVMGFDAERRGRLISARELSQYTRWLAVGVTEALHYFIGHDDPSPRGESRYLAVTAAHITHMLRDTWEDLAAGYFNVPCEYLTAHGIGPGEVHSTAYRAWVQSRVQLARDYFRAGREYLAQVWNVRCRITGHAYCLQFEQVLDAIEREACWLRCDERNVRI
jgi:phytoene/squalene synthetase